MFEKCNLPKKVDMKNAILEFLTSVTQSTPKEINEYIIKKFNISPKDYSMLNDYENTTIFAYRMCWIRTELRKEGLIENPKKGIWKLVR